MFAMLARLRLILTWLLLAALPLQGIAAASMALCQPQAASRQAVNLPEGAPDFAPTRGIHQAHDGHGHSGHDHAWHEVGAGHLAATAGDDGTPAHHDGLQADADHRCSACAMCGHALGLAGVPITLEVQAAPQDLVTGPAQRVETRVAPIPDKPPRA